MAHIIRTYRGILLPFVFLVLAGWFLFSVRAATQDSSLVGRWTFDEAGGTATADVSGNGNSATFVNNPLWTSGKDGSALYYQLTSYVNMGSPASGLFNFGAGQGFTVGAWVRMNSSGNPSMLISKGPATCSNCGSGFELITRPTSISFLVDTNGTTLGTFEVNVATTTHLNNKWHYIAGVRDGATLNLYIDGKKEGTAANDNGSVINSSANLTVGGRGSSFTATNAVIDDVSVYNRAFSEQEMFELFNRVPLPLSGYAWSSNVGWVKFSGVAKNLAPYGVFMDNITGDLSGDAWSSNVGWLSFDRFETGAPPSELSNASLAGEWKLNEGAGPVAADTSGNGNNGVLQSSPLWVTGRDGTALSFNGANRVDVGDPASNIFDFGFNQPFAVAAWFKMSATNNPSMLISKGPAQWGSGDFGYELLTRPTSVSFVVDTDGATPGNSSVIYNTTAHLNNQWHYMVGVRDGSSLYLYFDGALVATASNSNGPVSNSKRLTIGSRDTLEWGVTGIIDEAQVYSRALSASEILANFKATPLPQPVGYWKFDEIPAASPFGYWNFDETGTTTIDYSGNRFNGEILSASAYADLHSATGCKLGKCLVFDGVDDIVRVPAGGNISFGQSSVSGFAWVKSADILGGQSRIFGKDFYTPGPGGYFWLNFGNGVPWLEARDSLNTSWNVAASGVNIADNSWHLVGFVIDRAKGQSRIYVDGVLRGAMNVISNGVFGDATATQYFKIGAQSANSLLALQGSLDDMRIFNRVLTDAEMQAAYGVIDSSGGGNAGVMIGGSASTGIGKEGIINAGVRLNGADSYIAVGDAAALDMGVSDWTVSGWIKHSSTTATRGVVAKRNFASVNNPGYQIQLQSDNKLWAYFSDGSASRIQAGSAADFADGRWHHFAVVFNRAGNIVIYRDGIANGSASIAAQQGDASNAEPLYIGATNGGSPSSFFGGLIDDIRIHNRALIKEEVFAGFSKIGRTIARLNASTKLIDGWARFLSGTDSGWDGWIKFFGPSYTVLRDGIDLKGYAWGDKVVGWMSFNGTASDGSPYGVTIGRTNPNFTATLTVTPASGPEPLSGVEMKAQAFNFSSEPAILKFDCEDDGTYEYITPSPLDLSNPQNNPYTAPFKCTYQTAGTYHPKVVIEQISPLFGSTAEATADVTVLPALQVYGAPLTGYAWSSNIGWIKFAGKTTANVPYGVFADARTGVLSGYAWSGMSFTTTTKTILADISGPNGYPDGFVNGTDLNRIAIALGSVPGSPAWDYRADLNKDDIIDQIDIDILSATFGQTSPPRTVTGSGGIGWIDFGPIGPYPEAPNFSARLTGPKLDRIEGWARACAAFQNGCSGGLNVGRGGWDGWIKLTGQSTGITYAATGDYKVSAYSGVGSIPTALTFDDQGNAWAISSSTPRSVTKITPDGAVTKIDITGAAIAAPIDIDFDGTNLWVLDRGTYPYPITARTGVYKISTSGQVLGGPYLPVAVATDIAVDRVNGVVWMIHDNTWGQIQRVTTAGVKLADIGFSMPVPYEAINYAVRRVTVDTSGNAWVAAHAGFDNESGATLNEITVAKVTPAGAVTGVLTGIKTTQWPTYISYDPISQVTLTSYASNTIAKVDQSLTAAKIPLGSAKAQMATAGASNDLWAFYGTDVYRIADYATSPVVRTFADPSFLGGIADIDFDGANAWITNRGTNSITKVYWQTTPAASYGTYALSFDGVNDAVSVPDSPALFSSPSFTISMWVNPISIKPGAAYFNLLMGKESYLNSGFRYGVGRSEGQSNLFFWTTQSGGTFAVDSGNNALAAGQFNHAVVTYDANTQTGAIYMNGVEVGTGSGTFVPPAGQPLVISGNIGGTGGSNSVIDDIQIYNRALSDTEVKAIYSDTKNMSDPSLALYLRLDEPSGPTTSDYSGNNNDGTFQPSEADGPTRIAGIPGNYGIIRNILNNTLEGFAWGNDVVGWINFCDIENDLYCVGITGLGRIDSMAFQAIPRTGKKPLNDVDLKVVLDTPTPGIPTTYIFDCDINDAKAIPDLTAPDIAGGTYTAVDLCDYPNAGTYTAQVIVDQAGTSKTATTKIIVFPSDFREIPPS